MVFFMILTKHFENFIVKIPRKVNRAITLLFVNFCWILFRANSMDDFGQMMKTIFQGQWGGLNKDLCGFFSISLLNYFTYLKLPYWFCASAVLVGAVWIILCCRNVQEKAEHFKYSSVSFIWTAAVAIWSILSLSGVSTYIYAYF